MNALPMKKKMKNAFLENHIFTRFNLLIDIPHIIVNIIMIIDNLYLEKCTTNLALLFSA